MSALSGGVAPAYAKPDKNDPGIPIIPTPEVVGPQAPQAQEQAPAEAPSAPKEAPAPPKVQSPPQQVEAPRQQAPAPEVKAPASAPAPQIQAPAPKPEAPQVVDAPQTGESRVGVPKAGAPPVNPPKTDVPQFDAPQADAPKPRQPETLPAVDQPKPAPAQDAQAPNVATRQAPGGADENQPPAAADQGKQGPDSPRAATGKQAEASSESKAAQRAALASPDTLQAPEQDVQLARQATPAEAKPEPAKKDDVDFLSSALNIDSRTKLGPFESNFRVGSDFSVGDRDRDRDRDWDWNNKRWDHRVRQWDRRWIDYDDFYRPVFYNPFRAPVRIVYVYERAPRIVILPPLGRAVVDAAALAAYSFTAVVLNTANLAADVAVGTFFGGGYIPPIGSPFVPPPPLSTYNNVPVQVRYSNATYQPFRVNQIVDVGDDTQYGGRKVLLDGATPAWGQWTTSPTGERQFEVHRTQQYPGLGEPQEGPLPGDYRMQLASDESANADRTELYLTAAAGVVGGLGLGALGLAVYLGRRRPQL